MGRNIMQTPTPEGDRLLQLGGVEEDIESKEVEMHCMIEKDSFLKVPYHPKHMVGFHH